MHNPYLVSILFNDGAAVLPDRSHFLQNSQYERIFEADWNREPENGWDRWGRWDGEDVDDDDDDDIGNDNADNNMNENKDDNVAADPQPHHHHDHQDPINNHGNQHNHPTTTTTTTTNTTRTKKSSCFAPNLTSLEITPSCRQDYDHLAMSPHLGQLKTLALYDTSQQCRFVILRKYAI